MRHRDIRQPFPQSPISTWTIDNTSAFKTCAEDWEFVVSGPSSRSSCVCSQDSTFQLQRCSVFVGWRSWVDHFATHIVGGDRIFPRFRVGTGADVFTGKLNSRQRRSIRGGHGGGSANGIIFWFQSCSSAIPNGKGATTGASIWLSPS